MKWSEYPERFVRAEFGASDNDGETIDVNQTEAPCVLDWRCADTRVNHPSLGRTTSQTPCSKRTSQCQRAGPESQRPFDFTALSFRPSVRVRCCHTECAIAVRRRRVPERLLPD